jgi:prepilin-type N-terminal cleavage/methylation domain-containing protein
MHRLRQRLARDEGFTLIELLVVLLIISILLSIAIPSYLGIEKKAQETAAMSDVRAAVPDAEAFYSDVGSYTAMTATTLHNTYDSGLIISSSGSRHRERHPQPHRQSAVLHLRCRHRPLGVHRRPGGQVVNATTATSNPCTGF